MFNFKYEISFVSFLVLNEIRSKLINAFQILQDGLTIGTNGKGSQRDKKTPHDPRWKYNYAQLRQLIWSFSSDHGKYKTTYIQVWKFKSMQNQYYRIVSYSIGVITITTSYKLFLVFLNCMYHPSFYNAFHISFLQTFKSYCSLFMNETSTISYA